MEKTNWIRLELPNWKQLSRFVLWSGGRVILSSWLFSLYGTTVLCKGIIHFAELIRQGTLRIITIYDQLPYMGVPLQNVIHATAVPITETLEIITDLITAIQGRQLLIIGEMGTGKSTIAQYLAYTLHSALQLVVQVSYIERKSKIIIWTPK